MTKYFKLLGIALLATSMAFVSCGDEGDDTTDPGTNPPTEVTPGIKVTFGSESWDALATEGLDYSTYGMAILTAYNYQDPSAEDTYPKAEVAVATTLGTAEVTADPSNSAQLSNGGWIEYYAAKTWYMSNSPCGDWWAKSATVNVTEFDATAATMSVKVNAVMFELESIMTPGEGEYEGYMMIDFTQIEQATSSTMVFDATKIALQAVSGKSLKK
ncbi:MAG: hypothetical protein IKY79_02690 [Bacteroidales bacterium]|nr:hypothetical protein [Bacteroidales bacterium]